MRSWLVIHVCARTLNCENVSFQEVPSRIGKIILTLAYGTMVDFLFPGCAHSPEEAGSTPPSGVASSETLCDQEDTEFERAGSDSYRTLFECLLMDPKWSGERPVQENRYVLEVMNLAVTNRLQKLRTTKSNLRTICFVYLTSIRFGRWQLDLFRFAPLAQLSFGSRENSDQIIISHYIIRDGCKITFCFFI